MAAKSSIVGKSPVIESVLRLIRIYAASPATVMVTGESGTGKELVAQSLHQQSQRATRPFIPVNCAAIPRDLLESELFGHRKGAFSGAIADRTGRFELANGGTLFLDEIGDMSFDMQSKLLRVLQERVVDPVGGTRQISIDVRVVAATHRDLEAEVTAGRFREDLYYRLNVLPITLPSLRERTEDLPLLAQHFAKLHALPGCPPIVCNADLLDLFARYAWPGNIRELSNLMQRLAILFPSATLGRLDIPEQVLPTRMRALLKEAPTVVSAAARPTSTAVAHAPRHPETAQEAMDLTVAAPTAHTNPSTETTADAGSSDKKGDSASAAPESVLPAPPSRPSTSSTERIAQAQAWNAGQPNPVDDIILIANGRLDFPEEGVALKAQLAEFERKLIHHALTRTQGNISRTAQLLNLQRTTLIQKLNKINREGVDGIEPESSDLL